MKKKEEVIRRNMDAIRPDAFLKSFENRLRNSGKGRFTWEELEVY